MGLVVVATVVVFARADNAAVSATCYLGVLVGASVGAWVGAERAPRDRRLVPRLIAAGISLSALGDVLWSSLDLTGARSDASISDPFRFAAYIAVCAAMWVVLSRSRSQEGGRRLDADRLLDAATIVVVCVLIFWSLAVDAIVHDHSVSPLVRTVWAMYSVAGAVLLAFVVRVLMGGRSRATIGGSFVVGVCLWLGANVAYLQASDGGTQVAMEVAWMVGAILLARAAWRVHEVDDDAAGVDSPPGLATQIVLAVGPLFVPPVLEVIGDLRGEHDHPGRLFIGTAVLITLAIVRTARLIRSEEGARRELVAARDAALEASRAKSMFLANVSHEIRTPLTTVLATAEILEDTPLDNVQLMLLAKMDRSVKLLKSLVEGILDFSRIEAGELELASTAFDLHALVADTGDVYAPRAIDAGIRFEWDLDPRVPQMVVGDSGRLFQVLTNLLDNALKFTLQGRVSLVVRPASAVDQGGVDDVVEFVVTDTGIGIRDEDQESVFESFNQVDGSMTRSYGGSGLGLAICKELSELMGGCITVQSQFGAGSTFMVRIPVVHALRDHTTPGLGVPLAG